MDYKLDNFIGVFKNAYSKDYCESVIKNYNQMIQSGYGVRRTELTPPELKTTVDDTQIFSDDIDYLPLRTLSSDFNKVFWEKCYPVYEQEYAILNQSERHSNYSFKIQKTKIGGGYHLWHFESGSRAVCNRLLAWTLYLNDVHEGGETEFLYQHIRVKPEQGTLVIWPAAFTHTHRGNPPLSNEKYIVTGWTEYC
jgi:hypothetical protein